MDYIPNKYPPKSTTMNVTEFAKWKADKIKDGTWQGSDTPDAKYAKPDSGGYKRPF